MNQQPTTREIIGLLSVLESSPNGATITELTAALQPPVPQDTVRKWLDALLRQNWIACSGVNRFMRYELAPGSAAELARLRAQQPQITPAAPAAAAANSAKIESPSVLPSPMAPPTIHPPAQPPTPAALPPINPTSSPAAPGSPPPIVAPAVSAPAGSPAAELVTFAQMYPLAVLDIVGGGMDREAAKYGLRKQALKNGNDFASAAAYVANALAQLDALTEVDAEQHGISHSQFDLWRARWQSSAGEPADDFRSQISDSRSQSAPDAGPVLRVPGEGPPPATSPSPVATSVREWPAGARPSRRGPTNHTPAADLPTSEIENRGSKIENFRTPQSDAPSARDRLQIAWRDLKVASGMSPESQPLTLRRIAELARKLWSKRITFYGHTLTVPRMIVASLWAALWLAYCQRHVAVAASLGGVLSYLVAALPWLVFRLFDGGFTWMAGGQAVLVGGTVSYVLALPSRPFAEWLFGVTPRALAGIGALFAAATAGNLQSQISDFKSSQPGTAPAAVTTPADQSPSSTATRPGNIQIGTPPARTPEPSPAQAPAGGVAFTPPPPPVHVPVEPPAAAPAQPEPVDPEMAVPATEPAAGSDHGDATTSSRDRPNATGASRPQDASIPQSENRSPQLPAATTSTRGAESVPPTAKPIENRDSKIENPQPPFPTAAGAYVLVDNGWAALPRNNGGIVKSAVQAANGFFGKLNRIEDEFAGKAPATSTNIVGDLIFSGRDKAPPAPSGRLVIAYVGPLALSAKFIADYPMVQLEDVYALMELAPLKPMNNGNRYTPMCAVFGNLNDFGPRRLPATIETAGPNLTVLRCTAALPAGRYALACGTQYFELSVR